MRWLPITAKEVPPTTALASEPEVIDAKQRPKHRLGSCRRQTKTMRATESAANFCSAYVGLWRRPALLLSSGQSAAYMSATEQRLTKQSTEWQISFQPHLGGALNMGAAATAHWRAAQHNPRCDVFHRAQTLAPQFGQNGLWAVDYAEQLTIIRASRTTKPARASSAPPTQKYSSTILHFKPGAGTGGQS